MLKVYHEYKNKQIFKNNKIKAKDYFKELEEKTYEIYNKVKLEIGDYENNYINRLKYFYNIYAKNIYPDTTKLINNIDFINLFLN